MGEPIYITPQERNALMSLAAEAYDAVNNDEEDRYELPPRDVVISIFIDYARLTKARP